MGNSNVLLRGRIKRELSKLFGDKLGDTIDKNYYDASEKELLDMSYNLLIDFFGEKKGKDIFEKKIKR